MYVSILVLVGSWAVSKLRLFQIMLLGHVYQCRGEHAFAHLLGVRALFCEVVCFFPTHGHVAFMPAS